MNDDDYFDTMPIKHLRNEAKFWRREALRLADRIANERPRRLFVPQQLEVVYEK